MPLKMRRGTVLLATRNEFETLPLVLEEIAEAVLGLTLVGWSMNVLIVDDSDDDRLSEELASLMGRLQIPITVTSGRQLGLGAAVLQGFERCLLDPDIEFIVNLDSDGQHDARQMSDLLRIFDATEADITIGSRWAKGGRCYGLSPHRRIMSRTSSLVLRMCGVPWDVKDPTTSFRVYRRDTAEILLRELVGFDGFSFFGAGIAIARAHRSIVNETPINFRPRVGGLSNLSIRKTVRAVRDLPRIRSVAAMIRRREQAFVIMQSDPLKYSATRELEQLSNTPRSTRIILDQLLPHVGHRVLEVGAGLGLYTSCLAELGRDVTSLEPDLGLYERLGNKMTPGTFESHNLTLQQYREIHSPSRYFDTALYINVLEHIENDVEELRQLRELLRVGSTVVIFVPAAPRLYGSMDWISGHYRRYDVQRLRAVCEQSGLHVITLHHFDPVGMLPYWFFYRVLKKRTLTSGTVGVYDNIVIPLSSFMPSWFTRIMGGKNLIAVATRGSS